MENDPEFQKMWKELGGEKIGVKEVQKRQVNVQITNQQHAQNRPEERKLVTN